MTGGLHARVGRFAGRNLADLQYFPAPKATVVVLANGDIPSRDGGNPAPAIFSALAGVIAPKKNRPAG